MFKECERFRHFVKFSCEQEMELSSPKLKKLRIFPKEIAGPANQTKNLPQRNVLSPVTFL